MDYRNNAVNAEISVVLFEKRKFLNIGSKILKRCCELNVGRLIVRNTKISGVGSGLQRSPTDISVFGTSRNEPRSREY